MIVFQADNLTLDDVTKMYYANVSLFEKIRQFNNDLITYIDTHLQQHVNRECETIALSPNASFSVVHGYFDSAWDIWRSGQTSFGTKQWQKPLKHLPPR